MIIRDLKIKTWNEAVEFLKNTKQINTNNFDSMNKGEDQPNLDMPWHLELEYWEDEAGYYEHFLIKKSRPRKAYPKVVKTDGNCLPGDDEEKMMDFMDYMPGTRINFSWFIYEYKYLERCSFEFVGFKKFDSDNLKGGDYDFNAMDLEKLKHQQDNVIRHEKNRP
tara:strand:- start:674 stop:1168 length:495 start_codon:yes stop_codon:yes gene_type:complete